VSPFPEKGILPQAQQLLWPELAAAAGEGFVLYGGTAIALHLGHRQSVDFDFFREKPFDPDQMFRRLPFLRDSEVLHSAPDTLTALVRRDPRDDGPVKVSLFGGMPFGRVGAPRRTPDGVLVVASQIDLLGHKLKVLMQRIEVKDYLDIDALLSSGEDLGHGLAAAQALFPTFTVADGLKALTYFAPSELAGLDEELKKRLVAAARTVKIFTPFEIVSKRLMGEAG
jgi:hypothetical protein